MFSIRQHVKVRTLNGLHLGIITQINPDNTYRVRYTDSSQQDVPQEFIIPKQFYDECDDFNFAKNFLLHECESNKEFRTITGGLQGTCGYTGPGIGLVLLIFERNRIVDLRTLNNFLTRCNQQCTTYSTDSFRHVVNEAIASFLDLSAHSPITGVTQGLTGLIAHDDELESNEMEIVGMPPPEINRRTRQVTENNLQSGVNVISFKNRMFRGNTFHHSTIYTIPEENRCFILDSWMDNSNLQYRELLCREHRLDEVTYALVRLNSHDVTSREMKFIFKHFFMGPDTFTRRITDEFRAYAYVLDRKYMIDVYQTCEHNTMILGHTTSNHGGFVRMRKSKKSRARKSKTRHARKFKNRRARKSKKHWRR
jgi:hypothetical protein